MFTMYGFLESKSFAPCTQSVKHNPQSNGDLFIHRLRFKATEEVKCLLFKDFRTSL